MVEDLKMKPKLALVEGQGCKLVWNLEDEMAKGKQHVSPEPLLINKWGRSKGGRCLMSTKERQPTQISNRVVFKEEKNRGAQIPFKKFENDDK